MNQRQKRFADEYLKGMTAGKAYEAAGYECTGDAAAKAGHRLLNHVEVINYLEKMNKKTDKATILSIEERKEMLTRIASRTEGESPHDAIRAMAELSKMDGAYTPKKVEAKTRIVIGGDDQPDE